MSTFYSYFRERIIRLWIDGENVSSIVKLLTAEGKETTRDTVRQWIYRWQQDRSLEDKHKSGRSSKISTNIAAFMELQLEDEELQQLVARKFATEVSSSTIWRYLHLNLKWAVVRTRFGPMISDANKIKRLAFAKMCIETNDTFANVILTDESSIQLRRHCQTMKVKIGRERTLKPQARHTLKVHVWAGISMKGATNICIFD